jgi:hypothetical protein
MMRGPQPFSDRRYTDAELAQILDEAAKSDAHADVGSSPSEGYTLEEIREIASEAGIDPTHVERAAARLVAAGDPSRPAVAGRFPFSRLVHEELTAVVHEELLIQRSLSDDDMLSLAHHLESIVPSSGSLRQAGQWVEWRDQRDRLYLGIVRGSDQTRIRLIADQSGELSVGAGAIALAAMMVLGAVGSFFVLLPLGLLGVGSAGMYCRWRTRVNRGRLRNLLAILERVA